jgi:N-formylglutamate deformylase
MRDDPLVQAFEAAALEGRRFGHREHLQVAYCYLRELPLEEALARYVRHLKRLAAALGAPDKYHATMTWAYLVLLHEAMQESPGASFDALVREHPALLDKDRLLAHYDRRELDSARARRHFLLPRRRAGAG